MAFDPQEFLDTAEALLQNGTEGAYRSAISRAYYAAFWEARKYCSDEYQFSNSHDSVWQIFYRDRNANGDIIEDIGQRLRRKRNRADYRDDGRPINWKDALYVIEEVKSLIEDLRNLDE